MSPATTSTILYVLAYLAGGIPFGLLLGLSRGVDIRKVGSGNVGATNLSRALGRRWGIAAFLLDFSKGLIPVLLARVLVASDEPLLMPGGGWGPVIAGTAAILGHIFPVYLLFHGGKGVATTFGVLAALSWLSTVIMAVVWLAFFLATKTVSVASIAAAVALPVAVAIVEGTDAATSALPVFLLALAMGVLIIVRHKSNIRRLLQGEELASRKRAPHPTQLKDPDSAEAPQAQEDS